MIEWKPVMDWWEWIPLAMIAVGAICFGYLLIHVLIVALETCKALTATCHALQAWLRWMRAAGDGEACREEE